jgi:hypothetical protein
MFFGPGLVSDAFHGRTKKTTTRPWSTWQSAPFPSNPPNGCTNSCNFADRQTFPPKPTEEAVPTSATFGLNGGPLTLAET